MDDTGALPLSPRSCSVLGPHLQATSHEPSILPCSHQPSYKGFGGPRVHMYDNIRTYQMPGAILLYTVYYKEGLFHIIIRHDLQYLYVVKLQSLSNEYCHFKKLKVQFNDPKVTIYLSHLYLQCLMVISLRHNFTRISPLNRSSPATMLLRLLGL